MSILTAYRKYAPFTADRLIEAANAILGDKAGPMIAKRTLRFYTSQSVVPRPLGSPKFARYGYEHLLTMVAARALQDQGMKLAQIKEEVAEIRRGQFSRIERMIEDWMERSAYFRGVTVKETIAEYGVTDVSAADFGGGNLVKTFQLTPYSTLHVAGNANFIDELKAVRTALERLDEQANAK